MAIDTAVLGRPGSDHPPLTPEEPGGDRPAARWSRPPREWAGLATLLIATAATYLWNLSASGYANTFYAAAVQAGTKSWKAFFFGSIDSSNFITVDKPPASLWVMELSGRIFGFSSASLLLPQALEGVVTVALMYAVVRRWFGHRAGLLAGAVMATTPVAALMFRFDNPDALLVMLMTAAAYFVTRALEKGRTRWLAAAGAAVGLAFLSKMGQALLVVPGFGLAYLVAAPVSLRRRLWQLGVSLSAMVAAAGWWVLAVTLWPVADRPMIDGSATNSIWNLIVGYNGLSRLEASGGGGNFSGTPGAGRLFNSLMGGQASWLLPAALLVLAGGLVAGWRRPRTDRFRAALLLWGGWLVVTAAVFSYGKGTIHTYYTVALAPAIAALVAVGAAWISSAWPRLWARVAAATLVSVTGFWAVELLGRDASWHPWLRPAVASASLVAAVGFLASGRQDLGRARVWLAKGAVAAALVAGLGGPTAYTLETISTAHTGSVPSAGPASSSGGFGGAGGAAPGGTSGSGRGGPSGGPPGASTPGSSTSARSTSGAFQRQAGAAPLGAGGAGGGTSVPSALVEALKSGASRYRWVAATNGSQSAASLELATGGEPVMAIGGFNNQGGNLSLASFEKYVEEGRIHYFIASGGGGGGPGGGSSAIASWVESHFKSEAIGGQTVYDLTDRVS